MEKTIIRVKIAKVKNYQTYAAEAEREIFHKDIDELQAETKKLYALIRAEISYQMEIDKK